jgi:hypothetical protein
MLLSAHPLAQSNYGDNSMIARVLAQVIESLCVLKYNAVSLGQC